MSGISNADSKLLWGKAAGRCSNPECCKELTFTDGNQGNYNIGEMAHVIGRNPGAARASEGTGPDTYDNLVLLCPSCHRMIDKAPEGDYPKELLHTWKAQHEQRVNDAFKERKFSSFDELKEEVSFLLYENNKCFMNYGPHSEAASDPASNLNELWELKKLSVMVPNNTKIINLIQNNIHLLSPKQKRLSSDFIDHAHSWEHNQYNRMDSYPTFPAEFSKEFSHEQ